MSQLKPSSPRLRRCPICKKPREEDFTPFCSNRCRDKDLSRWFNDQYTTAGEPVSSDEVHRED